MKQDEYNSIKHAREEERKKEEQKRKTKKLFKIAIPVVSVVALIVLAVLFIPDSKVDAENPPKIEIIETSYNAGSVPIKGGLVKHTYEIKNVGKSDLKIDRIWTSCMCTTATIEVRGKKSSEFGMHTSSLLWSETLAPGETGLVEMTFDPMFHGPTGTGNMVRVTYLSTNDPKNRKAEVRLSVTVTP